MSDPNPPANNVPANKDDFFSYTEPAASEAQGAPIQGNQGFNDFNFDDYNGNQQQPAQDMSNQQDKGDFFFNDPQVSNPVQQDNDNDDGQIVAKKDAYLNYEDDQQQIAPQRPSYADDYGQIDKAPDIEQAKIL